MTDAWRTLEAELIDIARQQGYVLHDEDGETWITDEDGRPWLCLTDFALALAERITFIGRPVLTKVDPA